MGQRNEGKVTHSPLNPQVLYRFIGRIPCISLYLNTLFTINTLWPVANPCSHLIYILESSELELFCPVDMDALDLDGNTPLHLAVKSGHRSNSMSILYYL